MEQPECRNEDERRRGTRRARKNKRRSKGSELIIKK